jgi:primase-polymerase (primpol)-like protein
MGIRDGKPTKFPFRAGSWRKNGELVRPLASTDDSTTWRTFQLAVKEYMNGQDEPLLGIGFVFICLDPYCGIDFDNCLIEGKLAAWAAPYVKSLAPSYAEISPSGNGVKVWVRGSLVDASGEVMTGTKTTGFGSGGKGAIEVYDRLRFFAVTGNVIDLNSLVVEGESR